MIFKHSIKSIIRTPKKTILFLFLLILLTIILSIGAGMYESARNMLLDADETFTSVVELEYKGDIQGDEADFYKNMNSELAGFDFSKLEDHPDVKAVGVEKSAWAFVDDSTVNQKNSPLNNYAIVKISSIIKSQDALYMGIVGEALFGKRVRENAYMMINDMDELGTQMNYNFSADHEYLIIGKVTTGGTPTLIISPGVPETSEAIPCITDLTENPDFFTSEEGKQLLTLQEAMTVVENSLQVTMVSSLEAYSPYYFNELILQDGRVFSPEEYQEDNNEVILISKTLSDLYRVKPGDTMSLKLHYNKTGTGLSDYLAEPKFVHEGTYTVAGIFQDKLESKYTIYMPAAGFVKQELHSAILARYIVKNGTGDKFIEDSKSSLLPSMVFTSYDQGYMEAVKPVIALKNCAVIVIILGSLAAVAVLVLFSYLYVVKQKDTIKTMLSLGTGKRRTRNYILYGSLILVLVASGIGAAVSSVFLNLVTQILFDYMKYYYFTDLRYSERSIGLQKAFEPQIRVDYLLPAIIIGAFLVVSIILLVSFTNSFLKEDRLARVKKRVKKDKILSMRKIKSKRIMFGGFRPVSFKFTLVSLLRNPGRSFIIPLIPLVLSAFIIFLGLLSDIQQKKLDSVYEEVPVTAYITSFKDESREMGGLNLQKDIYRLIVPGYSYRMNTEDSYYESLSNGEYNSLKAQDERNMVLSDSKYIDKMYLYTAIRYEYMGISKMADGKENQTLSADPNIRNHNGDYGYDWFLDKINKMPKLAYADDIRFTPDYFNNSGLKIEFLEGYSYDSLGLNENIAIIPASFAETQGIKNGDTIRITGWINLEAAAACSVQDLKVVGIYDAKWRTDTIYIPWIISYDQDYYFDFNYLSRRVERHYLYEILARNVQAATFSLKNTKELSTFRDFLSEQGYSQVGLMSRNRRVVVIQDKSLEETVLSLKNHIRLINIIKPIMLILFGFIGFIVSYLLIRHRMNELAIMRSMGAKKRQVFFSFFLEQLILFIFGFIPAAVYSYLWPNQVILYGVSLLYFIACYLVGSALALRMMNRAKVLDILFTKE